MGYCQPLCHLISGMCWVLWVHVPLPWENFLVSLIWLLTECTRHSSLVHFLVLFQSSSSAYCLSTSPSQSEVTRAKWVATGDVTTQWTICYMYACYSWPKWALVLVLFVNWYTLALLVTHLHKSTLTKKKLCHQVSYFFFVYQKQDTCCWNVAVY